MASKTGQAPARATSAPALAGSRSQRVAGRVHRGVPAFLVTLALVLPLTILFARAFASVFETPFLRHQRPSGVARLAVRRHPRVEGAPV